MYGLRVVLAAALLTFAHHAGASVQGRWLGGIQSGEDYVAVVLDVDSAGRGVLAFPNQRRASAIDVERRDGALVIRTRDGHTLTGQIDGKRWFGRSTGSGEAGTFELHQPAVVSREALHGLAGVYAFDDGGRFRIAFLRRMSDDILVYLDERTGDERWLFPTSSSTFLAGRDLERPIPSQATLRFHVDASGRATEAHLVTADGTRRARRQPPSFDEATIASEIEDFVRRNDVPGVSVGLVTRDGLAWGRGFGFADREGGVASTIDTPYQVGSVTKVFTASLLTTMTEAGMLRLDDPIEPLLPDGLAIRPVRPVRPITFRDLVTHTSGLPANPVNRVDRDGVMQPYGTEELLDGLRDTALESEVGTRWSYSNLGFALLGFLLERKGGHSYDELLRRYVTAPLGMQQTAVAPGGEVEDRLAVHYWPEDEPRVPRPRWKFGTVAAFGGLISTVPDLARFASANLRDDRVVRFMQRPQFPMTSPRRAMGIGWMLNRQLDGTATVEHGGEVDGHSSILILSPTHGFGVIVLANLGGPSADALGRKIFATALEATRKSSIATRNEAFDLFFREEWADAAAALRPIARRSPNDGVAWLRLGIALARSQRFAEAREVLARAALLDFQPAEAEKELAALTAACR